MRIYRVEDAKRGGPYNGERKNDVRAALPLLFLGDGECEPRHPSPYRDILSWNYQRGYYFAFGSVAQLQNWFNEFERDTLRRLGFAIAVYEVDGAHVLHGLHQVAFDRDKASRARNRKSLTTTEA